MELSSSETTKAEWVKISVARTKGRLPSFLEVFFPLVKNYWKEKTFSIFKVKHSYNSLLLFFYSLTFFHLLNIVIFPLEILNCHWGYKIKMFL